MKITRLGIVCMVAASLIAVGSSAYSQDKKAAGSAHGIVRSGDLKWMPIIKGCELAPVGGDPAAEGTPFVVRFRCTAGTVIPAHWHPTDENLTVLQGTFQVGMGDKYDATKLDTMNPGNFATMPKEMHHYASCMTACVVQVHGAGPFKVNWINPADVIPPDAKPAK